MKAFFVTKRLAFGSGIRTWRDVEKLQTLGVTHVINLRRNKHGKKVRQFKNLRLRFTDDKKPRPAWFYRRALLFYERALGKRGCKVFVMCRAGICRSASLTYFLLRASGFTSARAEKVVVHVRPCAIICPAYREYGEAFLACRKTQRRVQKGSVRRTA
jgi:protein-tyrosine phosphatase